MRKSRSRFFQIRLTFVCLLSVWSTPDAHANGIRAPEIPKAEKPLIAPIEKEPQDWLAFVAFTGGRMPIEFGYAPKIMVSEDGRIFWRSDDFGSVDPIRKRERWREAKLSPQNLATFKKKLGAFNYFTVQKPAPEQAKLDKYCSARKRVVYGAATSLIGVQMHGKKRVVSEYALDYYANCEKKNRYLQTLVEMKKAMIALIPKESTRYEPKTIRVTLFDRGLKPSSKRIVPEWPLADVPNTKIRNHFYSGNNARILIAALGKNEKVVINDKVFIAIWAPAIAVPQVTTGKIPIEKFSEVSNS